MPFVKQAAAKIPDTSTVELTNTEMAMVRKALDYYGDMVADGQGYSAGEKYWNLINKFYSKNIRR